MSLRGRFVAASSAIALVTLSGASTAVWLAYNASQERQLDAALLSEAGESTSEPHVTKYRVFYDTNGSATTWSKNLEIAHPRFQSVRHPLGVPFDLWWNNEHVRAVLLEAPGEPGASLLLAATRTDLDEDAAELARRMAVAVFAAVVVSALATWWIARVLTRDHERITRVARRVADGDLSARIGPLSDDGEMRRLGLDLDEMISRLAILVETQQQFIANAAHELKAPVTTLLGELSFALRRERDANAYRDSIAEALASTRRLKLLTEDLLALARVGAADPERGSVALADVALGAIRSTRVSAEERGVVVETRCNGCVVEGHAGDLERLVRNLVENAVRHSPHGGRVRIEAAVEGDHARLLVSDEGSGIPVEVQERIFEPFFRLAADRADHTGTGLGLAIGRSIARAHGGDLWLELDDGPRDRGARFVARLPLATRIITNV
jgi:two-component system heavy metal sensor histidine kinase CusS